MSKQRLQELRDKKRLAELRAKAGKRATKPNTPGVEEYQEKLLDAGDIDFFKEDLNDIRFVVNLLTTGNLSDIALDPMGVSKVDRSRKDAETAATYMLNEKIGLPGKVVHNEKLDKFVIETDLETENGLETLQFDLDQTDNFVEGMVTKLFAASGELAQEGPRIAGGLLGLGALLAASTVAAGETATGAGTVGAPATLMAGQAADKGLDYVGNYTSELIARRTFEGATDKKFKPRVSNMAGEAAISTADVIPGFALGKAINYTGKLAGSAGSGFYTGTKGLLNKIAGPVVGEMFSNLENFSSKAAQLVGKNVGKNIDRLVTAVTDVQIPIMKGVMKQAQKLAVAELPAETGMIGNHVALLSNVNKRVFDSSTYTNVENIDQMVQKASKNTKEFITELKQINKDSEVRNIYQTQTRTYLNNLVKDIKQNLSERVTSNKRSVKTATDLLVGEQEKAITRKKTEITSAIDKSIDKITELTETQAKQMGELPVLEKEVKTINDQLQNITIEKQNLQDELNSALGKTKTGIPSEEVGLNLKREFSNQIKESGEAVRSAYSSIPTEFTSAEPYREQIQSLVDDTLSKFNFKDFRGTAAEGKVKTLFNPIGEFTEDGFAYKSNLTDNDILDFKTELSGIRDFFSGDTKLSNRQAGILSDLSKKIEDTVITPLTETSPTAASRTAANKLNFEQSVKYPEDIRENILGNTKTDRDTGELVLGKSGTEAYEAYKKLAKTNPTKAKELYDSFSPELQRQLTLTEKTARLSGAEDTAVDEVFGTKGFDLPQREKQLQEQLTSFTSKRSSTDEYINSLKNEIFKEEKVQKELSSKLPGVSADVTSSVKPSVELIQSTTDEGISPKLLQARAELERQGIDSSILDSVETQISDNMMAKQYQEALDLLNNLPGSTKALGPEYLQGVGEFSNKFNKAAVGDPALVEQANKLDDTLNLSLGLSGNEKLSKLVFENPDYLTQQPASEMAELVSSNINGPSVLHPSRIADLNRLAASAATFAGSRQAALANVAGSAAGTGTRILQGLGDGTANLYRGFAQAPTIPALNRLPMYQTFDDFSAIAEPLPEDEMLYGPNNPYRMRAEYNEVR